jgi:hypothetical protein
MKVSTVRVRVFLMKGMLAELELAQPKVSEVRVSNSAKKTKLAKLELAIFPPKKSLAKLAHHFSKVRQS